MAITVIPPVRSSEDRIDALGVLLTQCNQDELADIAFGIIEGKYRSLSNQFNDVFTDAYHALDEARAQWADRHEPADCEVMGSIGGSFERCRSLLNRSAA